MKSSIYELSAISLQGKDVKMDEFKGKTLLIVNTASKCGLTPQFEGLETVYKKYKDRGLVILGFPSNQFANQEPGDEKSIADGCVLNYGVTFPMFSKIEVNGPNTHPIYQYLKQSLRGLGGRDIKWNFTKFLISSDGQALKRFSPSTKPEKIDQFLQKQMILN
jgi:glutathione peroxidase